jgi:hypothetical protein
MIYEQAAIQTVAEQATNAAWFSRPQGAFGRLLIVDKNMWVGASEAVQRLHPGSAGVSPA